VNPDAVVSDEEPVAAAADMVAGEVEM
jgi:hypothetical protein